MTSKSPANRWKLRESLLVSEAAEYLSCGIGRNVDGGEIFQLALDRHLRLSVKLPVRVRAQCRVGAEGPEREAWIDGLWDLALDGSGRVQLEHLYHRARGLPFINLEGLEGAYIERDRMRCQLRPEPARSGIAPQSASTVPDGSVIVVRMSELKAVETRLLDEGTGQPNSEIDSSKGALGERERKTLLLMIAALAKAADVDISQASKSGERIAALISDLGHKVAPNTVARHLRKIRDTLLDRRESSTRG